MGYGYVRVDQRIYVGLEMTRVLLCNERIKSMYERSHVMHGRLRSDDKLNKTFDKTHQNCAIKISKR